MLHVWSEPEDGESAISCLLLIPKECLLRDFMDYRLVALTSPLKTLERLVLNHLGPLVSSSMDYQPGTSVEDGAIFLTNWSPSFIKALYKYLSLLTRSAFWVITASIWILCSMRDQSVLCCSETSAEFSLPWVSVLVTVEREGSGSSCFSLGLSARRAV